MQTIWNENLLKTSSTLSLLLISNSNAWKDTEDDQCQAMVGVRTQGSTAPRADCPTKQGLNIAGF